MEIGWALIFVGTIIIAFCSVTAVGVMNGKIEGVVTTSEKIGITAFLLICLITGYCLLHGGIQIINM